MEGTDDEITGTTCGRRVSGRGRIGEGLFWQVPQEWGLKVFPDTSWVVRKP